VIKVKGAIDGALVELLDETETTIAQAPAGQDGWVTFELPFGLVAGEQYSAVQTHLQTVSPISQAQTVLVYEDELPKPDILEEVYECGRRILTRGAEDGIPMSAMLDGNEFQLYRNVPDERWGDRHSPSHIDETPQGTAGLNVEVFQTICGEPGPVSDPSLVQTIPDPYPSLTSLEFLDGAGKVRYEGALVGERHEIQGPQNTLGIGYAGFLNANWIFPSDEDLSSGTVDRSLCNANAQETPVIVDSTVWEQELVAPAVNQPLCPGGTVVSVNTPGIGGGRIILENANQELIGQAAHAGDRTTIGLSTGLVATDMIRARQVFQSGVEGPWSPSVQVTESFGIELVDIQTISEQFSTNQITGYSLQSAGPMIEVYECCEEDQGNAALYPPIIIANVFRGSTYVSDAFLYRAVDGVYRGRWNFKKDNATPVLRWGEGAQYSVVVTTPCTQQLLNSEPFEIFLEEPLPDTTAPEGVRLKATVAGLTETVGSSGNKTLEVPPGVEIDLRVTAVDFEGLKRVEVIGATPNSPTHLEAAAVAPVPNDLVLDTTLDGLDAYESKVISGRATNFASLNTTTNSLTLVGAHPTPSISSISPSATFSDQTLTIQGSGLGGPSLFTTVTFTMVDDPTTTAVQNLGVQSSSQLNVSIPVGLVGKMGDYNVVVETSGGSPNITKTSNTETFELKDRQPGNFQVFSFYTGLTKMTPNQNCNSTEPGAINNITASASAGGYTWTVSSNGRSNENITFTRNQADNDDPVGAVVSSNCRGIATLSYVGDDANGLAQLVANFYYFPTSGSVKVKQLSELRYEVLESTGGIISGQTVGIGQLLLSPDGSLGGANYTSTTGTGSFPYLVAIVDPVNNADEKSLTGNCVNTPCGASGAVAIDSATLTSGNNVSVNYDVP
jgi:hypothetical protein